jgi:hypothetical protein
MSAMIRSTPSGPAHVQRRSPNNRGPILMSLCVHGAPLCAGVWQSWLAAPTRVLKGEAPLEEVEVGRLSQQELG